MVLKLICFAVLFCAVHTPAQQTETVKDADGNIYTTVKIGNQLWTVENWRSTKYNDGTAIPNVTDSAQWKWLTTGAYCYYDNNPSNNAKYGALYNWYAVNTGKLAPKGWHVPTDTEWKVLENYLIANGYNWDGTTSGNKIAKSLAATTDWVSESTIGCVGNDRESNNRTGFSALPGGFRYSTRAVVRKRGFNFTNYFTLQGHGGAWWSATEYNADYAEYRQLLSAREEFSPPLRYKPKICGLSLRLIRDPEDAGGVDDLIEGLMGGEGGSQFVRKKNNNRSKASIMRVVNDNQAVLRYAYNMRLREKPGLRGNIKVEFAIDQFGKVISCKVIDSSMNDPVFEQTIVSKIKRWVFHKIDKPGDVTKVVYPFVFQ